jgi:type VI secretion system protein ImpM
VIAVHGNEATLGLIGKHPGYGDFLRTGLSGPLADALSEWLDKTLSDQRDAMGNDWPPFWDRGQDLRFWIGRAVLGRTLAGVLRPSRDRVGRRYPFMLLCEGAVVSPPTEETAQPLWDALAAHLDRMQPGQGAMALLEGLSILLDSEDAATAATGPTIWAHHPEGDLTALLQAAARVDGQRALLSRSYWWAPGGAGRAAVWLGCHGLPDAMSLGWLLAGVPASNAQVAADA